MWNNSFFIPVSSTSSCFQIHSGRRTRQRIALRDASIWAPRSFQFKWTSGVGPCVLTLFFRVEAYAEGRTSWRLQEDTQCCSTWQSRQNILQKSTLRHTAVRGWHLLCGSFPFLCWAQIRAYFVVLPTNPSSCSLDPSLKLFYPFSPHRTFRRPVLVSALSSVMAKKYLFKLMLLPSLISPTVIF